MASDSSCDTLLSKIAGLEAVNKEIEKRISGQKNSLVKGSSYSISFTVPFEVKVLRWE